MHGYNELVNLIEQGSPQAFFNKMTDRRKNGQTLSFDDIQSLSNISLNTHKFKIFDQLRDQSDLVGGVFFWGYFIDCARSENFIAIDHILSVRDDHSSSFLMEIMTRIIEERLDAAGIYLINRFDNSEVSQFFFNNLLWTITMSEDRHDLKVAKEIFSSYSGSCLHNKFPLNNHSINKINKMKLSYDALTNFIPPSEAITSIIDEESLFLRIKLFSPPSIHFIKTVKPKENGGSYGL